MSDEPKTIKDQIVDYCDSEEGAIKTIRLLSGAFNPTIAVDLLAIINMIARCEEGDCDKETLRSIVTKKQDEVAEHNEKQKSRPIIHGAKPKKLWIPKK